VGFFGNLEEASAVILAKLDDDVLAFDLEFAQGDGLFHMENSANYRTGMGVSTENPCRWN
jgi:hypothetical protein